MEETSLDESSSDDSYLSESNEEFDKLVESEVSREQVNVRKNVRL